jgi:vacuole morphology and inheritance protein 14
VATENILADFLREIRDVCNVRRRSEEHSRSQQVPTTDSPESMRRNDNGKEGEKLPEIAFPQTEERAVFIAENDSDSITNVEQEKEDHVSDAEYRDTGGAVLDIFVD